MAKKKKTEKVQPKTAWLTIGFVDDDGNVSHQEFELTISPELHAIYMGLELEVEPNEMAPTGRMTIVRTPFRMV